MCITEIKTGWWRLVSEDDEPTNTLVFFGYSKAEVVGKLNSWIRRKDLEKWR